MTKQEYIELGIKRNLIEVKENKDGSVRIKYIIQNKEYDFTDPEEIVRAVTYIQLIECYKYPPYRIKFEVNVPRRTPNDWADIVVYSDDNFQENYIVVENKKENISESEFNQAIEQGFGNANSLRAKYLLISNFDKKFAYDIKNYPPNERDQNKIPDIPINYGLVPTFLYKKGSDNDISEVSFATLSSLFKKCHDVIWAGGKLDPSTAFDEMSKILFAKIQDEKTTRRNNYYKFQVGQNENEVIVSQRIFDLYNEARAVDPNVFTEDIKIPYSKIYEVVKILQSISLNKTDIDSKGQAFEIFLGVVFRGGLGQYFTRRQIVEFGVNFLEPDENDTILDPSCGSGGFLLYSMKKVFEQIEKDYEGEYDLISSKKFSFANNNIYGIEINAKIARVAMMDMIVNGDGHSNIENNTGLNNTFTIPNLKYGKFSLILTNPPFGVNIKKADRDNLGENSFDNFEFAKGKKSQVSDILFLEQYFKFLTNDERKNPRVGVVLQTGILNNPSNKNFINWLRLNFKILGIVNLPEFSFRKAGSGMKTVLLFLKKYPTPYTEINNIPNYKVFFGIADHIGYDSTLRPDSNELPFILEHYINKTEDENRKTFWLDFHSLDYRLDPKYYYNKFFIEKIISEFENANIKFVKLSELLENITAGKSPIGGVTRSTGEIPSITVSNITRDGTLDFSSDLNFVPDAFYNDFNLSKGELKLHDILIAKDGATTGKTAIIDESFPFYDKKTKKVKAIFSEHVFRLRLKKYIDPFYINAFLNSELGQLQLETITTGGAQGGITTEFVDNIYIPMVKEQKKVASLWKKGINKIIDLKKKYNAEKINISKETLNILKELTPSTKDEIKEIIK